LDLSHMFQAAGKNRKNHKNLVSAGTFSHCRYQYFFVFLSLF